MKALVLTLTTALTPRVDMAPLTAHPLAGVKASAIAKIKLQYGNRQVDLGELFEIKGDNTADIQLRATAKTDLSKLDNIGTRMGSGRLRVYGNTGDSTAAYLAGGTVEIFGNAGDWLGTGQARGSITVNGNAGRFVGAAFPGEVNGMKGGTIVIRGNADERVGDKMRRGIIIIEGNADNYCGARMVSGSIIICGNTGDFAGYTMKRGTILCVRMPATLAPSFGDCGHFTLGFLPLLLNSLAGISAPAAKLRARLKRGVRRYAGDLALAGQGEILVLQ